jgi:drug/metabolite transporter (DMT)-like permease
VRWNAAVAALASSWGFVSVIVAGVDLAAEALVFYRLAVAAASLLLALAVLRRLDLVRVARSRAALVLLGAVLAGHWYLFFETIKLSSVALALLTVYTAPIFLALLAPFFLPERRSPVAVAALVPAGGGLALIALAGDESARARPLAIATGLGAAVSYAGIVVATKRLVSRLPAATLALWNTAVAAAVLAPFLSLSDRVLPRGGEIGYLLLLGAVFTALSSLVYVSLLRRVTAQAVGVLSFLEVFAASLLAWAILGQPLGWPVAVGGLLVVSGGILVVRYEPVDAAAVESAPVGLPR